MRIMKTGLLGMLLGCAALALTGCGGSGSSTNGGQSQATQNISPQHLVGPGCTDIVVTIKDVEYPAIPDHGIEAATGEVVIELPNSIGMQDHLPFGECVFELPGGHGGVGAFADENAHTPGYPVSNTAITACSLNCKEDHSAGQLLYRSTGFAYYIQNAEYSNITEVQKQTFDTGGYMTYYERDVVYTGYVIAGDMTIDNGERGIIKLTDKPVEVHLHQQVLVELYDPEHLQDNNGHNAPR